MIYSFHFQMLKSPTNFLNVHNSVNNDASASDSNQIFHIHFFLNSHSHTHPQSQLQQVNSDSTIPSCSLWRSPAWLVCWPHCFWSPEN